MRIALIVPAYRPTEDMIPMLERFLEHEEFVPVVVNDGSGEAYEPIFARVPEGIALLRHEVNRGKGAALKTAMRYVLDNLPECEYAVTADADGQHTYEDIRMVTQSAQTHPGTLVLGSRAFDGKVPFKSRAGNAITRQVFAVASGVKLRDTQTGLRAFDRKAMEFFVTIPGERYEYEINMLLYSAREGIPMREETIRTIYIDDNSASSFNPLKDSIKIYMCIFKFAASSILAFLIDWLVFGLMLKITGLIKPSQIVARVVSATVNFVVNKKVVYQSKGNWLRELIRYALLALGNLVVSLLILEPLSNAMGGHVHLAYILVQVIMYILNFFIQGRFVYKRGSVKND